MDDIFFKPIGVIHTPFKEPRGTPIQPGRSSGAEGTIEIYPEFVRGLTDLEGFSHITVVYHFHLSSGFELTVTPFLDTKPRGLFSTRAPRRPNPIGISVVRLIGVSKNILNIENVDMVDGTPLLDIKPYVRDFDSTDDYRIGWLQDRIHLEGRDAADDRFDEGKSDKRGK
jgi:tRNA-Thr(GGU) m(6)t(6)A37 methyltransferase TsaA